MIQTAAPITPDLVLRLNPRHPAATVAATKLQMACTRWAITSPRQVAMLLAQLAHESGLIPVEENLNYRAVRICQVWPSRFPTLESAQPYAFNPKALGNRVYGGRMGNAPDEGYRNRGRGQLQITGADNLQKYGALIGYDLLADPDGLLQYGVSSLTAGAFWASHGLNALAERGDIQGVTRAINGGLNGLDDRERLYQRSLNNIPRYGLLETDAPLDVVRDTTEDLARRDYTYQQTFDFVS